MRFLATEEPLEVSKSVRLFQTKVQQGCSNIGGFSEGSTCWNAAFGYWSHFQKWKRADGTDRYWNTFGFQTDNLRKRIIVEINPPVLNMYKGMQGVLAKGDDKSNWIFHRGRLSIPGRHISEEDFDSQSRLERVVVNCSDGRQISCFPIAMLDQDPTVVQDQILRYINECRKVRHFYMYGQQIAEDEDKTLEVESEAALNPELTSSYLMPSQKAKIIERKHAVVWNALTAILMELDLKHTNERIGRWGPDLIAIENNVLFEIKITTDASDIQRALGQLLLYEALLDRKTRKVIVIPGHLPTHVHSVLKSMYIEFLYFRENNGKPYFSIEDVQSLFD